MSEHKKRKVVENVEDDPEPKTGTQSPEVTLSAENDQLRAETKYLKESLADLRNSVASKDKLVDALERMLDTANKEIERLQERQVKEKTPEDSSFHIHPVRNNERTPGRKGAEISTISSLQTKNIYTAIEKNHEIMKKANGEGWHSNVAQEPVLASYTLLRLTELPRTGGGKKPNYTHIILQNLTCMSKIRFGQYAIVG
ncbi:family taurine dioxygenase [Fusarium pseudoanthophilum]|uniref:Family taurine dioxygenase n=1 Tax=Fusarium pseudoanthophilum TaxID=48495 RepID=A0A8H5KNS7_9HYPO|nr:family taurine dioxygenase [Fusarium pseudoanthophilum]